MAAKRSAKPPTTEELLTKCVAEILDAERITPAQIYDLLLCGYRVYKQGMGLPPVAVWDAVLAPFRERGRPYLNPYQMAALADRREPEPDDFLHLGAR